MIDIVKKKYRDCKPFQADLFSRIDNKSLIEPQEECQCDIYLMFDMTCNSVFILYSVLISSSVEFQTITTALEDTDRHIFIVLCHTIFQIINRNCLSTKPCDIEFLKGFLGYWAIQT